MGEVRRYKVNVRHTLGCIETESYIWVIQELAGS